jgi:hypothetical protein
MLSTFGGGFVTAAALLDWSEIQYNDREVLA